MSFWDVFRCRRSGYREDSPKHTVNLRHLRIGQRLTVGFAAVIALFLAITAIAYSRMAAVSHDMDQLVGERYAATVDVGRLKSQLADASRSMMNALVMTDDAQVAKELALIAERTKAHDDTLLSLSARLTDEASQATVVEIKGLRDRYAPAQASFVKLVADGNKDDALVKYMFSVRALQAKYLVTLDNLVEAQHEQMLAARDASAALVAGTHRLILALALGATALSVLVGGLATRSIVRPLLGAVKIARRVAAGDLSTVIDVRSRDETGQLMDALRDMNDGLRRIVGDVRHGTESIASASSEIASGNLDLSSRTETQASALEHTNNAIKQLTQTVGATADTAREASQLASATCDVAQQGGQAVGEVVKTMGSIDASSKRIVAIIATIDGIAFQTNILALNAAVEAARAGEQGRGFAVVASEVRMLAQRSAAAAREIKGLIQDSVDKVAIGSELVARAGQTMDGVVDSVRRVAGLIGEIAEAGQTQSRGIASVSDTLHQLDATTQQNAALVEEAAAAAESLKTQAASLEGTVRLFKLDPAVV